MSQTFGNLKDLSRLMGGAVQERWEDALGRMTRNILDPNTEPRRARKITMVLTIKPTESRDGGEMSFCEGEFRAAYACEAERFL